MQVKKAAVKLCLALAVIVPCMAWGQTSSINAFSPYSMYGLGELRTPGTLQTRSMGGVGVGMRNAAAVNLLNPAAYSAVRPKSFLFDFGLEGQCFYNSQKYYGQTLNTSYYTVNFHDIAFQLPIAKHLGLGFSLTPYSSVGYRMKQEVDDDEIWGNIGRVQYQWDGDGDVTEVKLGLGWEIFRGFSIGIAAQYYWGDIQRIYKTAILENITGGGLIADATGTETYSVSRFKGQFGVQWSPISNRRRILTIGATYDIGGDLNPNVTTKVQTGDIFNTVAMDMGNRLGLKLPQQVAVGIYYNTPKIAVGADYVYQDWGGRNRQTESTGVSGPDRSAFAVAYTDTHTIKAGVEYTPNRYDVRNFLKRWSYRAGFRYGTHNQTYNGDKLGQYAVTLGVGMPVKFLAISSIDVGVEYGRRGYNLAERLGLVRQQYFKFSIGFTLFAGSENGEYWFLRPKYD
jgi:hypothetical protein